MKLIDAELAAEKIMDMKDPCPHGPGGIGANFALDMIAEQLMNDEIFEPVDAVEVVRCKDCVSYGITTNNGNPLSYMCGCCGPNDFCSCGRKKNGSN